MSRFTLSRLTTRAAGQLRRGLRYPLLAALGWLLAVGPAAAQAPGQAPAAAFFAPASLAGEDFIMELTLPALLAGGQQQPEPEQPAEQERRDRDEQELSCERERRGQRDA